MKFTVALISAAAAVEWQKPQDTYLHEHTIYGEETLFRDVEIAYDEIEYSIATKTETEIRTRQVPITTEFSQTETKYRPEEEVRNTPAYEINYRPNDYQRFTWEPRLVYGYYTETKYRDVPFTTYETHYEILYREEEEHRYRTDINILTRTDSETHYRDEPETRYTNEYSILYREDEETRYNTVFDTQYRIEHETQYRTEDETRYNTVYETAYRPVTSLETREVPVINYETAYRDEEEVNYVTEYETRTRDVPVERVRLGYHSNDSGDGVESEPGHGHGHGFRGHRGHGRYHAQVEGGYITSDSSDDAHHYTVTEYVTEEYQVAKKVPVVQINSVPYQVARTDYVTEEFEVETLEPVEVAREVPYTVSR